MKTLRGKIKEILETIFSGTNHIGKVYNTEATDKLVELFQQTVEEVIGEDEKWKYIYDNLEAKDYIKFLRNKLRVDQRARLKDIIGGEK